MKFFEINNFNKQFLNILNDIENYNKLNKIKLKNLKKLL